MSSRVGFEIIIYNTKFSTITCNNYKTHYTQIKNCLKFKILPSAILHVNIFHRYRTYTCSCQATVKYIVVSEDGDFIIGNSSSVLFTTSSFNGNLIICAGGRVWMRNTFHYTLIIVNKINEKMQQLRQMHKITDFSKRFI